MLQFVLAMLSYTNRLARNSTVAITHLNLNHFPSGNILFSTKSIALSFAFLL